MSFLAQSDHQSNFITSESFKSNQQLSIGTIAFHVDSEPRLGLSLERSLSQCCLVTADIIDKVVLLRPFSFSCEKTTVFFFFK